MYNDPKGSNWRKWDLHVHTPASLVHNYPGTSEESWESFIADLEGLPEEFKVIGINDYIFIDGYRRVLEYKDAGRLKNIDLILPVIELRLDKFGGTKNNLSRVNLHVIFSNEVSADHIQNYFLNGLHRGIQLSHIADEKNLRWSALLTRESLADLGRMLKESSPISERGSFGKDEDEGFNNINFSPTIIKEVLSSHFFEGKYLTAIGKTEWANIKWNDQSIADKKDIIANAHFVFISTETPQAYHQARESLTTSRVNDRLLDCSDAHSLSTSPNKDRIGNCFTWIKSDPTFEGLRHVVKGFDERVFIGDLPDKVVSVKANQTKYIHSVKISKKENAKLDEIWFDNHNRLEFNHGLVAIIGNKGSAKSALTDIIGLLGATRNHQHFSFLSPMKFRQASNNKAKHFEAIITWESGVLRSRALDESISSTEVESIKYIPQNFFETVCNEVGIKEGSEFDKELEQVIFSHVEKRDRLGKNSLNELIDYRTSEINSAISQLKSDLQAINKKIVETETLLSEENRQAVKNKLDAKKQELETHRSTKPQEILSPDASGDDAAKVLPVIEKNKKLIEELDEEIKNVQLQQEELAKYEAAVEKAINKIGNVTTYYKRQQTEFDELGLEGITFSDIVKVEINQNPLGEARLQVTKNIAAINEHLNPANPESLIARREVLQKELQELQQKLAGRNKEYQNYLKALKKWQNKEKEILSENANDSIQYYERTLLELELLPGRLTEQKQQRVEIVCKIYSLIETLAANYKELYAPVQNFIQRHPLAHKFSLNFDVSIVDVGFRGSFFDWINHGVVGSFCGKSQGEKALEDVLAKFSFNKLDDVISFLDEIMRCLTYDIRSPQLSPVAVKSLMRKNKTVESLYDYIFSLEYLKPHYVLKMGDKEMHQLSPGEKGSLLLVFYLLVDKDDIPLIIDQPEENLDNQTVVDLLVPSIDEARKRRQIFIVTHNPNLAVVCDSDQVVCAALDKKNGHKVEYFTGSIENREINQRLLDVLEGTRPAFNKRQAKYIPEN